MKLYGQDLSQNDLLKRTGELSQFAGVKLYTLENGIEKGVRVLEFKTGSGLSFQVMLDRAMDIGDMNYCGASIGWHSPTGFTHPSLYDVEAENGLGWLRGFSGFMMTCGLDHILGSEEDEVTYYNYPARKKAKYPLHGRVAFTPAKLISYGEKWVNGEYLLWAEGKIKQVSLFGENLTLTRRIETKLGSNSISLNDTVTNTGFTPCPHMLMYHINLGYPILDENSRYLAPIEECIWTSHPVKNQNVGYKSMIAPQDKFQEQVYEHKVKADKNKKVPVALVNEAFQSGRGIGLMVEYDYDALPCLLEWQSFQSGTYVLGIEPSTNHVLGRNFAKQNNQLIMLQPNETKKYQIKFKVLTNQQQIKSVEQKITQITPPLSDDFVTATQNWHLNNNKEEFK